MEERRQINRVGYLADAVIVTCDTFDKYYVKTDNVSPLGMGIIAPADMPEIVGKDVIIVAQTMIMYADVTRQEKQDDGSFVIGVAARQFTPEVLAYLFEKLHRRINLQSLRGTNSFLHGATKRKRYRN